MRAADLRHRVTIESYSATQNAYNEEIPSWSTVATVWAAIEPLTGQERFLRAADQFYAENQVRIRIRYRAGVTAKMRVVDADGEIYDIQAVLDRDGRRRELVLMCTVSDDDEG